MGEREVKCQGEFLVCQRPEIADAHPAKARTPQLFVKVVGAEWPISCFEWLCSEALLLGCW